MQIGIGRREIIPGYPLCAAATNVVVSMLLEYRCTRRFGPAGNRNAKNQPRRGRDLLRGPRLRTAAVADPRLFIDLGDVEGPDRGAVETPQTRIVGHARPWPVRLPRRRICL